MALRDMMRTGRFDPSDLPFSTQMGKSGRDIEDSVHENLRKMAKTRVM
jgi:hypothetical protein